MWVFEEDVTLPDGTTQKLSTVLNEQHENIKSACRDRPPQEHPGTLSAPLQSAKSASTLRQHWYPKHPRRVTSSENTQRRASGCPLPRGPARGRGEVPAGCAAPGEHRAPQLPQRPKGHARV